MIHPFTRTVIYGAIWYQGKLRKVRYVQIHYYFDLIDSGENNAGNPTYACKFARMIVRWREVWNTRTNGITDINFPFGFVQVSFAHATRSDAEVHFFINR